MSIFSWASCKGDDPAPKQTTVLEGRTVLVACEGSFGTGNAAVTVYKPESDSVFEDVYSTANGGSVGDVLQSITLVGGRFFLCVNNSDKVVAVSKTDLQYVGSLPVSKPRYILPVAAQKAYVSSLYSNKLSLIDPQLLQVNASVVLPHENPEGMLLHNNRAWIACWDTACNKLYAVDVGTNAVADSIALPGAAPQEILEDAEGKFWVLSGNVYRGKAAHLVRIDPASKTVISDFSFPQNTDPLRLCTNAAKDTIYFLEVNYSGGGSANGVFRMNINAGALPQQAFVAAANLQYFWGIGIEPSSGNIYVADPKGFIMRGAVNIYNPQGQLLKSFNTGVGPGHFYFQD